MSSFTRNVELGNGQGPILSHSSMGTYEALHLSEPVLCRQMARDIVVCHTMPEQCSVSHKECSISDHTGGPIAVSVQILF
jgi:hypothetical protein